MKNKWRLSIYFISIGISVKGMHYMSQQMYDLRSSHPKDERNHNSLNEMAISVKLTYQNTETNFLEETVDF